MVMISQQNKNNMFGRQRLTPPLLRRRTRPSPAFALLLIVLVMLLLHSIWIFHMVYLQETTTVSHQEDEQSPLTIAKAGPKETTNAVQSSSSKKQKSSLSTSGSWWKRLLPSSFSTKQTTQQIKTIQASSMGALHNPTVFVGIISAANHTMAYKYRQRHRQLFALWNSSKLCSLHEYEYNLHPAQVHCQVIYAFILGIPNDDSLPTVQLEHHETVRVPYEQVWNSDRRSSTTVPPPDDWNATDIIYLNIQENMNAGKTPTYFYFATGVAEQYGFRFVVKHDSDAFFRLHALLHFVRQELPAFTRTVIYDDGTKETIPTHVLATAFRHKAWWYHNDNSNLTQSQIIQMEDYWMHEYYAGMHLYMSGECYLVSLELAQAIVDGCRRLGTTKHPYLAGHEDHDATVYMEMGLQQQQQQQQSSSINNHNNHAIRWIGMPKHVRFWEHPVKADFWWNRILKREQKRVSTSDNWLQSSPLPKITKIPRVLLTILVSTPKDIEYHRERLYHHPKVCPWKHPTNGCQIKVVFVTAGLAHQKGKGDLERKEAPFITKGVEYKWEQYRFDMIPLYIGENRHKGMIPTLLRYLHFTKVSLFDYLMILDGSTQEIIHIDEFIVPYLDYQLTPHSATHHILLGSVRDKHQIPYHPDYISKEPREFPLRNESYFYHEQHNIHNYVASECYLLSQNLIGPIVEQASKPDNQVYLEGTHHGHDISTLAYLIEKTNIHLIPVLKSRQFWKPRTDPGATSTA